MTDFTTITDYRTGKPRITTFQRGGAGNNSQWFQTGQSIYPTGRSNRTSQNSGGGGLLSIAALVLAFWLFHHFVLHRNDNAAPPPVAVQHAVTRTDRR